MKTPAFVLKTFCCTLLMFPIMASCSKDDEEKTNPEKPKNEVESYVLELEDISGGTFNGGMYLPTAGTAYYSDGSWGNNPHASGAERIGMIGYLDDATKTVTIISLVDINPGQYYRHSEASALAGGYTTVGTNAGDWYVGSTTQWMNVINALAPSSGTMYSSKKEVWQGGAILYSTINKRLSDAGGTRLNGGYWINTSSDLIIFNARDGFYLDDDINQYLESVRPFMNATLSY